MQGVFPGTLFVVATPIGNLEDITLRALRVLREVAVVAAEDTRRTGNLLRHFGISTPLISLHEHNEHQRRVQLVARLQAGESVALVSDAGTPGISDPGALLVRAARESGIRVDPVPGPSAVTAVLSASGLQFERFAFAGFPPVRSKDRKKWFVWVNSLDDIPVVCFEAPHRIHRTLVDCRSLLVGRPIITARELTKAHEQWSFLSGDTEKDNHSVERGEYVLIVAPKVAAANDAPGEVPRIAAPPDELIASEFGRLTELPSRRAAVKAVAEQLGLTPKAVYAALERAKKL